MNERFNNLQIDEFSIGQERISLEAGFNTHVGADSFSIVERIMEFENIFNTITNN
tara:strand:+ start:1604 stop:1768 length:165 start_codon:yes stop_codon:yes gene_type:complete